MVKHKLLRQSRFFTMWLVLTFPVYFSLLPGTSPSLSVTQVVVSLSCCFVHSAISNYKQILVRRICLNLINSSFFITYCIYKTNKDKFSGEIKSSTIPKPSYGIYMHVFQVLFQSWYSFLQNHNNFVKAHSVVPGNKHSTNGNWFKSLNYHCFELF